MKFLTDMNSLLQDFFSLNDDFLNDENSNIILKYYYSVVRHLIYYYIL